MKIINTPADKAKVTTAIRAYLQAKAAERAAKSEADKRRTELLEVLDGDATLDWNADDGRKYRIAATYNKTQKTLNAELVKQILGVEVTPECYKASHPWSEIRITVVT